MTRFKSLALVGSALVIAACSSSQRSTAPTGPSGSPPDFATTGPMFNEDGGPIATDDGGQNNNGPDPCGDNPADPACQDVPYGTVNGGTFKLQSDNPKDPNENDIGLNRDVNGFLGLDSTHTSFNYLWIANTGDAGARGTVSKIDSKAVKEVARYYTVTCYSNKTGSTDMCDGTKGCCSVDDWNRYQARVTHMAVPGHQAIQITGNAPSRTSVDFNGDLFISNRAFGVQSSVTKVANDQSECIDRNHNGKIDTSSDTNGDGVINIDCNNNGTYDDIADVKMTPCQNGMKQEFYGQDDECVLWTSNTFVVSATGRPLGLSSGDNSVSDAWAGSYDHGNFVRIDGITGLQKADGQLPGGCNPYGFAADQNGIIWAPNLGSGKLCYFDTKKPANTGAARDPQWGQMQGYGVSLDRDQNVWVGSGVERYTPDRSNGFANLGNGWWTKISGGYGIGIAADNRNANTYYVYSCSGGSVLQIPASTIKPMKMDQQINNPGWPTINMQCYGVGVDSDQNVWGVSMGLSTRALVDKNGMITQPVMMAPKLPNGCPQGDMCPNAGAYTYSDFTGFGLRNFTRPSGTYDVLVPGCHDNTGAATDTQWWSVNYDADVPPNTTLTVHAKSGDGTKFSDPTWATAVWTVDGNSSPFDLQMSLSPNLTPNNPNDVVHDSYLWVEFVFKTQASNASPKLKSFDVTYKCSSLPG